MKPVALVLLLASPNLTAAGPVAHERDGTIHTVELSRNFQGRPESYGTPSLVESAVESPVFSPGDIPIIAASPLWDEGSRAKMEAVLPELSMAELPLALPSSIAGAERTILPGGYYLEKVRILSKALSRASVEGRSMSAAEKNEFMRKLFEGSRRAFAGADALSSVSGGWEPLLRMDKKFIKGWKPLGDSGVLVAFNYSVNDLRSFLAHSVPGQTQPEDSSQAILPPVQVLQDAIPGFKLWVPKVVYPHWDINKLFLPLLAHDIYPALHPHDLTRHVPALVRTIAPIYAGPSSLALRLPLSPVAQSRRGRAFVMDFQKKISQLLHYSLEPQFKEWWGMTLMPENAWENAVEMASRMFKSFGLDRVTRHRQEDWLWQEGPYGHALAAVL